MAPNSSPRRRVSGARAAGALLLACLVALGAWWVRRAAGERALGEALSGYADLPFPTAGDPVDEDLADLGADVFRGRCSACHVMTGEEKLGPSLAGVTRRRELGWIAHMILRPDSMTANDPVAAALKEQYGVQMLVTGDLTPTHVRAVVEFLRRADAGAGP